MRNERQPRWVFGIRGWGTAIVVAFVIGAIGGLGAFTFIYADGSAYLTNDPQACANCHVMQDHLDAWSKSTHKAVATCNDCHAPHDAVAAKLWTKALNGFNHSLAFTTGRFEEPIRITDRNRAITQDACRHCHQQVVDAIDWAARGSDGGLDCIRCHRGVGHP